MVGEVGGEKHEKRERRGDVANCWPLGRDQIVINFSKKKKKIEKEEE